MFCSLLFCSVQQKIDDDAEKLEAKTQKKAKKERMKKLREKGGGGKPAEEKPIVDEFKKKDKVFD